MKKRISVSLFLLVCSSVLFAQNISDVVSYTSNGLCLTDTGNISLRQYEMTINVYFDTTTVSAKYDFYNQKGKKVVHIGIPHLHRYYFDYSKEHLNSAKEKMFSLYVNNTRIPSYKINYSVEYSKLTETQDLHAIESAFAWDWYYDKEDSISLLNGIEPRYRSLSDFKPVPTENVVSWSDSDNSVYPVEMKRNPILSSFSESKSSVSNIVQKEIDSLNNKRLEMFKYITKRSIDYSNIFFSADLPVFVVHEVFDKDEHKTYEIDYSVWNLRYQNSNWRYFKFPFQSFCGFTINDETSFLFTINLHGVHIESELPLLREKIETEDNVIRFRMTSSEISQFKIYSLRF